MQALLVVVNIALGIALPHWLIRWDARRLEPERRARGFNAASHSCAVVVFSWIAVIAHCTRTRRGVRGFVVGIAYALAGAAVHALLLTALAFVLPE